MSVLIRCWTEIVRVVRSRPANPAPVIPRPRIRRKVAAGGLGTTAKVVCVAVPLAAGGLGGGALLLRQPEPVGGAYGPPYAGGGLYGPPWDYGPEIVSTVPRPAPVPEPGVAIIFAIGAVAVIFLARRR